MIDDAGTRHLPVTIAPPPAIARGFMDLGLPVYDAPYAWAKRQVGA